MTLTLADLSVTTPVGVRVFRVKINSLFRTSNGRIIASVTALPRNGISIEPFCLITHGGPMQSATCQVPLHHLFNLHREELAHSSPPHDQQALPTIERNIP